ncbi:substrate-binding domain-containing protein [Streptomyces sp. RFCAC02]|uniref:substrate-binding domain-containing protein n=1 Tax=Streptomyces sp. RFCAC02 TaxID=2499143 RepID=UPI00143CFC9A|nr:substrate-binding domain-containing protein [Streptomyces sp. RFCAC02]
MVELRSATARRPAGRATIGLVTANLHLGVGATLWAGVIDACARNDVNLVCFPGDALHPGSPRNALYDLLAGARVDGTICWSSTLGLAAGGDRAARLARRLAALGPVISLNRALDGRETDTLLLDSHAGMREAVSHLVRHHGRHRLACLRGPLANPVSRDRFRAYTDALTRHRIPRDRRLVSASLDYASGAGAAAMRVLLDVRGLRPGSDFDAVVACSDVLAADALRLLTERGIRVPDDVALISFNDSAEARISDPPLTSVALPFAELGALAVDTLLARLRGTRPPARRAVPGTLVIRRSCGCASPLVAQGAADAPPDADGPPDGEPPLPPLGPGFLPALERRLAARTRTPEDAAGLDRALLRLRARTPPTAEAERAVAQARLMVADKARRLLEYERWTSEQEARRLRALATALTTATDTAAIAEALDRHLPGLGIPRHRLALLPRGPDATAAPLALPVTGDRPDRFTAVLEPLHIGAEHLGHAVFETEPPTGPGGESTSRAAARRGALCRALGDHVSAALKGVRLFEEVREARDAAERASRFKTRVLDNATDELRTPVETILRHTGPGDPAHEGAARLLRLIDDLLDLSRSQTDALALDRRLVDPRPLLTGAGAARHRVPARLPAVRADPARLRQVLGNLVAAAGDDALLTAAVAPPYLTVLVRGTAPAVPRDEDEQAVFQPFATRGLGLAVARRLAALHGGTLTAHRAAGALEFRLDLPLPTPAEPHGPPAAAPGTALLTVDRVPPGTAAAVPGLWPRAVHPDDDITTLTAGTPPAAVAWDTAVATPQAWATARRLHGHPALRHTPFLLYGPAVEGTDLAAALRALRPAGIAEPAVVACGAPAARERLRRLAAAALPGSPVRAAADGTAALALLAEEAAPPALLVTDRVLPDMDGFDLVERLPGVPALMLSDAGFSPADVRRAEPHPGLVLLGHGILDDAETARLLAALVERAAPGRRPAADPAPVRHALAYIEQHYRYRFSRWQVAQAAGVSEDHLGRLFHRELGVTLWEYLTRLRISRAKERLQRSDDNVETVARAVGFHDRAYFSRVFRRVTGVAPHAWRDVRDVP